MISPRKTRSSSTRGEIQNNTTNMATTSTIPPPTIKDNRATSSLIPIRPASTRQPFRPTVRQASNSSTAAPMGSSSDVDNRKAYIGLKPPTAVKAFQNRGPSYNLHLKGSAVLRRDIQAHPVAPPTAQPADESPDESIDGSVEDDQPGTSMLRPAVLSSDTTSTGSPPRRTSLFRRSSHIISSDQVGSTASASSPSTALSDLETDTAASTPSSLDHSDADSESDASSSDEAGVDRTLVRSPKARSRTPVFFGTPSKDEQEQRRRYSRRVRERRILRRDSLELARRKTLTLEEVEDAARAFREEKAAAELATDNEPQITIPLPEQDDIAPLATPKQTLSAPTGEENSGQALSPDVSSKGSQIADVSVHSLSLVESSSKQEDSLPGNAESAETFSAPVNLPLTTEEAEVLVVQEEQVEAETLAESSASQGDVDLGENASEEDLDLSAAEHIVLQTNPSIGEDAAEPEPIQALKDITNVPNHRNREEDVSLIQDQVPALENSPAPSENSPAPSYRHTAELLSTAENAAQATSSSGQLCEDSPSSKMAALIEEDGNPLAQLHIPDLMDQTLAFDRLEKDLESTTQDDRDSTRAQSPDPGTSIEDTPIPFSLALLYESDISPDVAVKPNLLETKAHLPVDPDVATPPRPLLFDETLAFEVMEDLKIEEPFGQLIIEAPSLALKDASLTHEHQEKPGGLEECEKQMSDGTAREAPLPDVTVAFEVAESNYLICPVLSEELPATSSLPLINEATEPSLAKTDEFPTPPILVHEEQDLNIGLKDIMNISEDCKTQTSTPDVINVMKGPATPTQPTQESPSVSYLLESPGIGLSFRRHYDENLLASAVRRSQQGSGRSIRSAISPVNDSLRSLGASPAPLSISGSPLSQLNANLRYPHNEVDLSPSLGRIKKCDEDCSPVQLGATLSSLRESDSPTKEFTPQMLQLMNIRDALLKSTPSKSPRKGPLRVPSPSKTPSKSPRSGPTRLPYPSKEAILSTTGLPVSPAAELIQPQHIDTTVAENDEKHDAIRESITNPAPSGPTGNEMLFRRPEVSKSDKEGAAHSALKSPLKSSKVSASTALSSRLPKAASGGSRIAKPTSSTGGLRAPTTVTVARPKSRPAVDVVAHQLPRPIQPASSAVLISARNPLQKKSLPQPTNLASSLSRPPSSTDSNGSPRSSISGSAYNMALNDPRSSSHTPAGAPTTVTKNDSSPVKRASISALRKLQGTSQLSSYTHKTVDWLKNSTAEVNTQWTIGSSVAALSRDRGMESFHRDAKSESENVAALSPIKASTLTSGSGRARRVPAGSKEATHAPIEAKAVPLKVSRALMSSTPHIRTESDADHDSPSDVGHSSSPEKVERGYGGNMPAPSSADRGLLFPSNRKPSSAGKSLRGASISGNIGRGPSRTVDVAPASCPPAASLLSDGPVETASSPSAENTDTKPDGSRRGREWGHRSVSQPVSASSASRASSSSRSLSNPIIATSGPAVHARASRAKVNDSVPQVPISSSALASLTTRNSRRNEVYLARLSVVTIRIEGARPPSPSSKIRKSSLAEGAPPLAKGRADEARAVRAAKRARESQESSSSASGIGGAEAPDAERGGVGVWRDPNFRGWEVPMAHHRLGAGEEEIYSTPSRVRKRAGGKSVRWRKNLFIGPATSASHHSPLHSSDTASIGMRASLVCKDYQLDRHGNAISGDVPPSPSWKRVRVTVRKIVYDDDEECDDEDGLDAMREMPASHRAGGESVSDGEYGYTG